jgi:hypothetical protein
MEDGLQVLEKVEYDDDDDDDDFKYEEIIEEDDEDDDDLADALASLQQNKTIIPGTIQPNTGNTITQVRPSVVDDFVRNFMIKAGLKRSLEGIHHHQHHYYHDNYYSL